jgi:hypothetical protein
MIFNKKIDNNNEIYCDPFTKKGLERFNKVKEKSSSKTIIQIIFLKESFVNIYF